MSAYPDNASPLVRLWIDLHYREPDGSGDVSELIAGTMKAALGRAEDMRDAALPCCPEGDDDDAWEAYEAACEAVPTINDLIRQERNRMADEEWRRAA